MKKFKVGDKLVYVYLHKAPREVIITQVGRKWLTLGEEWMSRVNAETLMFEFPRDGRCYLSSEHYEEVSREEADRERLRIFCRDYHLNKLSIEAVREILAVIDRETAI